jgi:hypothetical protein
MNVEVGTAVSEGWGVMVLGAVAETPVLQADTAKASNARLRQKKRRFCMVSLSMMARY